MKVLVLGAGAVGGYFGGRLAEKGGDVTFLVRERRRGELQERGLVIHSVNGDVTLTPKLITSGEAVESYDVILLTMKAYHYEEAVASIRPYVGEETMIIPLLNGIAHLPKLQETFGVERVLGGLCFIESTLNEHGEIVHTSKAHRLAYGEWKGGKTERIKALEELFAGANAVYDSSENIQREMWHKYLFITTLSGMTTLMQSSVGPIRDSQYGQSLTRQLLEEAAAVMRAHGAPIDADIEESHFQVFQQQGYKMKSSMLRDMEKGLDIEADHLQGYLLKLAEQYQVQTPLLQVIYNNLKVYEMKRAAQE
ncbi:2-dehydropantoate 2-reductase [Brevibacillus dissolubilis]|uniref:2-dehydropantoate 2-reductase n=1 Tax=Brevibacillus dissolubilis TaxID=1844116 RepID=UPI001117957D|nr:2-dehydropantoate 2-reductase [Brevibacillus dissolubilis]